MKQSNIFDNAPIEITIKDSMFLVSLSNGDMVNLNQLHLASGKRKNQAPAQWLRLATSIRFIDKLTEYANVDKSHILKTARGEGGGTQAHWQIALAYAKYLSPEIHLQINQVFRERLQELIDPELAYARGKQRAIDGYQRQGKSNRWIATRFNAIETRKEFTDTLCKHGVKGIGFSQCTNAIYKPVLGSAAKDLKKSLALSPTSNLRNNLTRVQNIGIEFAEALASADIQNNDKHGNKQCTQASRLAGESIKKAIVYHKNNQ